MLFLANEKEIKPIPDSQRDTILKEEALCVLQLCEQGVIRQIYFNEKHEAVIIIELGSLSDTREVIATLPLVKEGFITFDVMELHPYTGFSRLKE